MNTPTDYRKGYEKARAVAPEIADKYIAHMHIGDPLGEAMTEDLAELSSERSRRLIQAAMNEEDKEALRDAPASLREFFREAETPPEWLDYSALAPAVRMFHRNSQLILAAFVAGVLIEGFTTNIAKSFFITGRVRDQGIRRLGQNNRHMMEIFLPGGLYRYGDGWKLSVRIRIIHARTRHLLKDSEDWDTEAWGIPISAAHLGYAISAFSARLLKHMKTLGAKYNDEEYKSFMAVWRYSGYLMGIPEAILFRDADEALKLYEVGLMCEPDAPLESVVMAHSLVNSAPLIAGVVEPAARRSLARYVYRISRGLIGQEIAESLMYPPLSSFGAVGWFKLQKRYQVILTSCFRVAARTATTADSRPCSKRRCSTMRESATRCPTTCTRKSRPSGEACRLQRARHGACRVQAYNRMGRLAAATGFAGTPRTAILTAKPRHPRAAQGSRVAVDTP